MNYDYDSFRQRQIDNIAATGQSLVGVGNSDTEPTFTYTIGNSAKFGYELLIIGLPPAFAAAILNHIHRLGLDFKIGQNDGRFLSNNVPVRFYHASKHQERLHDTYVCQADRFYGREIKVIQVVFPDKTGLFPHEINCAFKKYPIFY